MNVPSQGAGEIQRQRPVPAGRRRLVGQQMRSRPIHVYGSFANFRRGSSLAHEGAHEDLKLLAATDNDVRVQGALLAADSAGLH